jgi:O-antigen/teichoic acid export membrane protein
MRAFELPLLGQTVTSFMPPVLLLGGAIVASQFGPLSFQVIGSIACVAAALTAIAQLDSLRRSILRRLRGVTPQSDLFKWIRVSLPIMASTLIMVGAQSIDWLVVASLTSVAESAIYRIALYLLSIQGVMDATFYGVVGTYISRNYHQQGKEEYQAFIRKLNGVRALATFVVFLVLFCAAGSILGIYGPDLVAAATLPQPVLGLLAGIGSHVRTDRGGASPRDCLGRHGRALESDSCPQAGVARCLSSFLKRLAGREDRLWELRDTAFEHFA